MKPALLPALLALSLAACGGDGARKPPSLPPMDTFRVVAATAGPGHDWDGVVEAVRRADLAAQTDGRVAAVEADVDDRVKQGDVLLRITAIEQQAVADDARARLRASEAAAIEAEQTYRRYAGLANGQYVSKLQLDQARAARDAAIAARDAAHAQLAQAAQQADYTVVRAPFDGVVSRRHVEPGETVAPGQALMSVYAPGDLRIEVLVPQSSADAIRRDSRARVLFPDGRVAVPARVLVFPAADVASHSINVRVVLPALDPAPAPRTTAKVVFDADRQAAGAPLRIPASAVAQRGELSGVYVRDGDRLLLRQVRLGARIGGDIEAISGLRVGDEVVRDPVKALQALEAQRKSAGTHDG